MSLTVFMAICILGCDFMLYVLFQWLYGEKHRKHVRKSRGNNQLVRMQGRRPYVIKTEKLEAEAEERVKPSFTGNQQTLHIPAA
ncbi:MAG TPA: hypothetical protein VEI73_17305 [Candidatus Acidoferrum sp.]|nr:hypothetical protein [Candidatus Acidoferrum sp.]